MLSFAPLSGAVDAAYTLVTNLSQALSPLGGAVAAIVAFTAVVRLLLHPLTRAAVRGEKAKAALAPAVARLREVHGKDAAEFSRQLMDLYRAERISPFAGLLPMLAQAPIFMVMYQLFANSSVGGHVNGLLTAHLLGVPLGARLLSAPVAGLGWHAVVFLALFAALAVLAWLASRRAAMIVARQENPPTGLLARLPVLLPYLILVSAVFFPLAAGIYLVTTTAWTAGENALLKRGLPVM